MRIGGGGGLLYISSCINMYLILMHISVSIWIILNFNKYSVTASIILEID